MDRSKRFSIDFILPAGEFKKSLTAVPRWNLSMLRERVRHFDADWSINRTFSIWPVSVQVVVFRQGGASGSSGVQIPADWEHLSRQSGAAWIDTEGQMPGLALTAPLPFWSTQPKRSDCLLFKYQVPAFCLRTAVLYKDTTTLSRCISVPVYGSVPGQCLWRWLTIAPALERCEWRDVLDRDRRMHDDK